MPVRLDLVAFIYGADSLSPATSPNNEANHCVGVKASMPGEFHRLPAAEQPVLVALRGSHSTAESHESFLCSELPTSGYPHPSGCAHRPRLHHERIILPRDYNRWRQSLHLVMAATKGRNVWIVTRFLIRRIQIPSVFHECTRQKTPATELVIESVSTLASVAGIISTWYEIFGPCLALDIRVNAAAMSPPTELPARNPCSV